MAAHRTRLIRPALAYAAALAVSTALVPIGAAAQDGPETPVVGVLTAIAEKRFDDLSMYFCPEFADQASGLDLSAAMTANLPPGLDPQLAVDALAFSVTGPSGEAEPLILVLSEDEAATVLSVEATITVGLDPAASEPFIRAIVENELQAQGMEVTDENVAALMTLISAQLGAEVAFNEYIGEVAEVIQTEAGTWLICGGSIVGSDTEPAPLVEPSAVPSTAASSQQLGPLPYALYVAALEAFTEDDPFAGLSDPPTKDEIVTGIETMVANATAEQERLVAVVPEECYAEAHQELLDYWQSSIELTGEAAAQLDAAASLEAVGAIVGDIDAELQTRHPVAYVEATDGSGGFEGSSFNILEALATCESPAASGSPAP